MNGEELKIALCDVDGGRFEDLIKVFNIRDECHKCEHFNLSIKDTCCAYRCKVSPSCIAATLDPDLISYLNWQLEWIDIFEHLKIIGN